MIGTILWRPHLGTLANSLVILSIVAWLGVLYYRYRSRYTVRKSWFLTTPKILFALLLVIALLDPCWRVIRPGKNSLKVVVLSDASASMDVKDRQSGSRAERAERIASQFEDELGDWVDFKTCQFDVDMRDPENKSRRDSRGTDIGKTLVTLSQKPDLSDCKAVVMLTDGGDEAVNCQRIPGVPMYIVGVGTDPSGWNDLSVSNANMPSEVEVDTPFKVSADISASSVTGEFSLKTGDVKVTLEKLVNGEFKEIGAQIVDLRSKKAHVEISAPPVKTEGANEYRLAVKHIEGETTYLNNQRSFRVDVRHKNVYVLLYGRTLDWSYALLKRELQDDPTIRLTALYPKDRNIFRIEGSRQEGDEIISSGFPTDEKVLSLYKCIIIGSFRAMYLRSACFEALKKYVAGGGSVIFLGGRNSFGRGGYGATPAAPLIPWQISGDEREITAGEYPITVSPEGSQHGMMSLTADILEKVSSPVLHSVNHVGPLRSGAISLMNASVGQNIIAVVALQPYGKGQTLGLATDTLWRWSRKRGNISGAYGQFWRDAMRHMCGLYEGDRFLNVKWDRKIYRSNEEAAADIRVAGRYTPGEIRITGLVKHAGESKKLSINPIGSDGDAFETKIFFPERGEYSIQLETTIAGKLLDRYERTIRVGSAVNEGANLDVDRAFLENLAERSGGYYKGENEAEHLIERLREKLVESGSPQDLALTQEPNILNVLPVYILLAMGVLIGEWVLRRRMNML